MDTLIRLTILVTVVLLLAAYIAGIPFAYGSEGLRTFIREIHRGDDLQRLERFHLRRCESRKYLAQEIIAQRCSLSEALARWQEQDREWLEEVNRECPHCTLQPSKQYQRQWFNAENNYCCITETIKHLLSDRPKEKAAVLRRLERDYRQLRAGQQTPSTVSME